MYKYFNIARSVANTDPKQYDSIRNLTIDIAKQAGYHREEVVLKNGKHVIRTKYNTPNKDNKIYKSIWNDVLVAKWMCYFEKLFTGKLGPHPELKEFYSLIIWRTFMIYMNAFQMDKCLNDSSVVSAVNLCLSNRIGEFMFYVGSHARKLKYIQLTNLRKSDDLVVAAAARKEKNRLNLQQTFEENLGSLDALMEMGTTNEEIFDDKPEMGLDPLLMDLRIKLKDNKPGLDLLNAMLNDNSADKINPARLANYVHIDPNLTLAEKEVYSKQILDAWHIIINTLKESMAASRRTKYNWDAAEAKKININILTSTDKRKLKILSVSHINWENSAYELKLEGSSAFKICFDKDNKMTINCIRCNNDEQLIVDNKISYIDEIEQQEDNLLPQFIEPLEPNCGLSEEQIFQVKNSSLFSKHCNTIECHESIRGKDLCRKIVCSCDCIDFDGELYCKNCHNLSILFKDLTGNIIGRPKDLTFVYDLMKIVKTSETSKCTECGRTFLKESISDGKCLTCQKLDSSLKGLLSGKTGENKIYNKYRYLLPLTVRLLNLNKISCVEDNSMILFKMISKL